MTTDSAVKERIDIHNAEVPVLCRSCEARHKGICGTLLPNQLIELSRHTRRLSFAPNTAIAFEGDEVERYANILQGVVKLSKSTRDGRQQIVALQFAPDLLGRPLSANTDTTVETATEVKACVFPRGIVDRFMTGNPELEHRIHQQSARELEDAHEWILTLGRKTALERVAGFIWYIAEHVDPEHADMPSRDFTLPLSRAEMADFLGLTIETVSRQVSRLKALGIIKVENNRDISVPDVSRLKALNETG
jgi:CRP/FNR family transcriptional regulator, anaerobic regulatory protein